MLRVNEKINDKLYKKGWKYFFIEIHEISKFAINFFRETLLPPYEINETMMQFYKVGYQSIPLVSITAFIMGVVLTIQSRPTLADFGAVSWLPSMVTLSIITEIGPVLTALICAGKIGSGIGAELGSMKVTEQIEAMEVSGSNPFKYLVITRVIATTLMIPLLVVIGDAVSLIGGFLALNLTDKYSFVLYFRMAFEPITFQVIFPAVIKTFFFGLAIGITSCYMGYRSEKGTEGVGKSANMAVVYGSLMIFIIDVISVQMTNILIGYNP